MSRRILLVLIILVGPRCHGVAANEGKCDISQATYESDMQFENQHGPTVLRIMGSRYVDLRRALRGLNCSHVPLVAFDGLRYQTSGKADDPGIYYIVPLVAHILHLRLEAATDLTLMVIVCLGSSIGLVGFLRTARTPTGRRIGIIGFLLITVIELIAGDVYIMNASMAVASVPWILYFSARQHVGPAALLTFVLVGISSQLADFVRAHAGTALVMFAILALVGLYQMKPLDRVVLAAMLVAGGFTVHLFCHELYLRRNSFLDSQQVAHQLDQVHVFWHAVYLGLAYFPNPEVPAYRDEVAMAKARILRPSAVYPSAEYEEVLKKETFEIVKHKPLLLLENLLLKCAVIILYFGCAVNIGLYAAYVARKDIWFEIPFAAAISFNSLFGLLVIPNPKYLLGLIGFAALYGIYSIEWAAQQFPSVHWLTKIRSRMI